jgi:hypothetical protein
VSGNQQRLFSAAIGGGVADATFQTGRDQIEAERWQIGTMTTRSSARGREDLSLHRLGCGWAGERGAGVGSSGVTPPTATYEQASNEQQCAASRVVHYGERAASIPDCCRLWLVRSARQNYDHRTTRDQNDMPPPSTRSVEEISLINHG